MDVVSYISSVVVDVTLFTMILTLLQYHELFILNYDGLEPFIVLTLFMIVSILKHTNRIETPNKNE